MSRQDKLTLPADIEDSNVPDDDMTLEINLRLRLDEVADLEAGLLRLNARRRPSEKELRRLARRIYESRRMRDRVMDDALFGEPAWDMLLALYHLPALGHMLSVSGLNYCSGVAPTTALRWQNKLLSDGLIERGINEHDARMHFVRLTEVGRSLLDRYLTRLFDCERPSSSRMTVIEE